jgi:ankyrin repeat protein
MSTIKTSTFDDAVQAVIMGDTEALSALLAAQPDLIHARSTSDFHATLLHYVAANGVEDELQKSPANAVEIANILLGAGAEIDALAGTYGGGNAQTTLALLVSSGHPAEAGVQADLVKVLCDGGAQINGLDNDGLPLATAITFGHRKAAEMLAECGARVDNLIFAAALGQLEKVKSYLTDNGKLRPDITPYTIKTMANAEGWTGTALRPFDDPVLMLGQALVCAANHGRIEVVRYLLEQGVDVNSTLNFGDTALHQSAVKGHIEVVKLLADSGADVNRRDQKFDATPVEWASHGNEPAVVEYLLKNGAIDLQTAAAFGVTERVESILSAGSESVNGLNESGTPLRSAAVSGHTNIVQLLLEHGADQSLQNPDGLTALDWAEKNGHEAITKMLKDHQT